MANRGHRKRKNRPRTRGHPGRKKPHVGSGRWRCPDCGRTGHGFQEFCPLSGAEIKGSEKWHPLTRVVSVDEGAPS